jgi:hypothetical protein
MSIRVVAVVAERGSCMWAKLPRRTDVEALPDENSNQDMKCTGESNKEPRTPWTRAKNQRR